MPPLYLFAIIIHKIQMQHNNYPLRQRLRKNHCQIQYSTRYHTPYKLNEPTKKPPIVVPIHLFCLSELLFEESYLDPCPKRKVLLSVHPTSMQDGRQILSIVVISVINERHGFILPYRVKKNRRGVSSPIE